MAEKTKVTIEKAKSRALDIEDLEISFKEIGEEEWEEEMGPTPKPHVTDLRSWDFKLLERYKPFYAPFCDMCCLCTFGKCDLTDGNKGACGINIQAQQGRMSLLISCMGTSAHAAHARHLLEHLIEKKGEDHPIELGINVLVEAPIIRTVIGKKPEKLGDLEEVLDYVEQQLTHLLSATNIGQEGNYLDFESKALHAGMLDNVAKEVCDIVQIVGYDFPKGDPNAPLVELGMGAIDKDKPVILCIGHNVAPGAEIIDYMRKNELEDKIEVCGICCTAHDLTRYSNKAKIVGPLSHQLRFIRSGIPDVIVVDEQCVRTDVLKEAKGFAIPVVATSDKMCLGLRNRTNDACDEIVKDLTEGKEVGALILNPEKVGEVVTRVAMNLSGKREKYKKGPEREEIISEAARCTNCGWCSRHCPNGLPISDAMKAASVENLEKLAELYELCNGCGRCENDCEREIKVFGLIAKAAQIELKEEKYVVRSGRGPIQDVEIRNVGPPIVLGEIPGVIAFVGCPNYASGYGELAEMAEEFIKRNYIVVVSGCAAMDIARYKDDEGKTLYEKYPGVFDRGGLTNVGSCVANAHILGAAIKIPSIFARKNLRGNFEEIADYILNRVGAVAFAWGAMSQKAYAIATGVNRWGIPVILGPHGSKYRRLFLGRGDKEEEWILNDKRTKRKVKGEPAPEHLVYCAESKEEAIVMAAKLCIRPNDTTRGRQIKLSHYVDLYKKNFGSLPDDLDLFVRTKSDIPITNKEEILEFLGEKGWKEREPPREPSILDLGE